MCGIVLLFRRSLFLENWSSVLILLLLTFLWWGFSRLHNQIRRYGIKLAQSTDYNLSLILIGLFCSMLDNMFDFYFIFFNLFSQLEHMAFFLVDLCLVEYEALAFKPSLLCASALYVARCTLQITPPWTPLLHKHARYDVSQIRHLF